MRANLLFLAILVSFTFSLRLDAQTTERTRPAEWTNLVFGGRFMDLFLPMRNNGKLTSDTWGAENVVPRYINNGIENKKWSFWCASIKKVGGKYHMFTAAWLESSNRGHAEWPRSITFHAVSDKMDGPYVVKDTLGAGHNPEVYQLKNGRWVVYVIDGYYISNDINGPWTYKKFDFQNRDRRIIDGMTNLTFARREDGSYLMINRGGGTWISKTGDSTFHQVSDKSAYPAIRGEFEDPVVWRDNIQYHLIVNDWLGRIAYYLRSKDGINWKQESGEAYTPGVSVHEDGKVEAWHKYERMRVLQDNYGRAIQANFAVIDVEKALDKPNDNHSSKNICIPLTKGRLLTILDKKAINIYTKEIRVRILAEADFNPLKDIDVRSLRFGGAEQVNYGKGAKVLKTEKSGRDLIVTFDGKDHGIPEDDYVAKLIGKSTSGKLLTGYARLPGINFIEPILSPRMPVLSAKAMGFDASIEIQNFGQVDSKPAVVKLSFVKDGKEVVLPMAKFNKLKPFEKTNVQLNVGKDFKKGVAYDFIVTVNPGESSEQLLHGKITPNP
ncbi:hypothetical protein ACVWYN_003138 [Pedobacter sp. UYP24]